MRQTSTLPYYVWVYRLLAFRSSSVGRAPKSFHWRSFFTAWHLNGATVPSTRPARGVQGRYFRKGADELYTAHRPDLRLSSVERMRLTLVSPQCPRRQMNQKKNEPGSFGLSCGLCDNKDVQPTYVNGILSCSLIFPFSGFAKNCQVSRHTLLLPTNGFGIHYQE